MVILNPQLSNYASNGLIKATNFPDFIFNLLASLPLFFVFGFKKENRKKMIILILIVLILSYSFYFNTKFINYDPKTKEVGEYIKMNTNKSELIISPKAVAYYAERRFYNNENNKPELIFSISYFKTYIEKSWENKEMDDEFFWPKGIYSGFYPPIPSENDLEKASYVISHKNIKNIKLKKKIGDFYIYKL